MITGEVISSIMAIQSPKERMKAIMKIERDQDRHMVLDLDRGVREMDWKDKVDSLPEEIKVKFKCDCGIEFGEGCFHPLEECESVLFCESGREHEIIKVDDFWDVNIDMGTGEWDRSIEGISIKHQAIMMMLEKVENLPPTLWSL